MVLISMLQCVQGAIMSYQDERKILANELRLEIDKIRYQWEPPQYLTNERIKHVIDTLRGNYVFIPKDQDN